MHHHTVFLYIALIFFACSCGSSGPQPSTKGEWQEAELPEQQINIFHKQSDILFAGTNNGVYKKDKEELNTNWSHIGLATDTTEILDIITWSESEIMIAVGYEEYYSANKVLYKTDDGGNSWISYNDHFTGPNISNFLRRIAKNPNSPDIIFALGGLPVARSTDRGLNWKAVYKNWQLTAFGEVLKIDPQNPEIIWAGGQTNIFTPRLVKSTNGGTSWEELEVIQNAETRVFDIIIKRSNSNQVLAGLAGSITAANVIRKSTDSGQSWQTVMEDISARTLVHSARKPTTVYASGRNSNGTLFFAASGDFGNSWERVQWDDSPTGVQVNDMVSVMEDGQEVLYFGTNKGIYSYRFEE